MTTITKTAAQPESGLIGAHLSADAIAFCRREGITSELILALDLVSQCFTIDRAGDLVIEIQVQGGVRETVSAHKQFALQASQRLGSRREMILLHYEII
jgi:hypothetical protein